VKGIRFTKAVATGNDFIIVDNRSGSLNRPGAAAKKLCDRKSSVGADGLLLIERSAKADLRMRIFNSDGSEAEMCGNGSRCAALYALRRGIAGRGMSIDTLAGVLKASVTGGTVKVMLTEPKDIRWNFCLMIHKCPYKLSFVNTGVPHVVHFVDDLDRVDVKELGSHMRNHGEFAPAGTNADFVKIVDGRNISVRTYERGVEDETLACGTGSVASALIAAEAERMGSPVTVTTRSGEKLKVYFDKSGGKFKNVYLEGKARLVFDGVTHGI
jgi:diaminopimelate epimerase